MLAAGALSASCTAFGLRRGAWNSSPDVELSAAAVIVVCPGAQKRFVITEAGGRLGAVVGAKLADDVVEVDLDRIFREADLGRDLLVLQSARNEFQHLHLARERSVMRIMLPG